MNTNNGKLKKFFGPTQLIVISFATVILVGTLLLIMPFSSRAGVFTSPINALFTATSATCVTGLIVVDTYNYFSPFGQAVILALIQIGGLGFMTIATVVAFIFGTTISLNKRILLMQSMNIEGISGIVRLTKHVLIATFFFESVGAFILSIRFIPEFGIIGGISKGIFIAVSAFCNAGFDLMGVKGDFVNLTPYVSDTVVNIVVMGLIIIGGLGFYVWEDIYRSKKFSKLTLYSKLVLFITAFLICAGAISFFVFEFSNALTMDSLSPKGRVLASFFQSVTTRTAGFNTISQDGMHIASKVLSMILMFIGGASGSTAGGIKVVTAGVIILTVLQVSRGRKEVVIFGKKISQNAIMQAITITFIGFSMVLIASIIIASIENVSYLAVLYECFSAFGTVGLSIGITPTLTGFSKFVLVCLMFSGRVGILTIALATAFGMQNNKNLVSHPEASILIG